MLLHLGPNVTTFRTLLHLGQLLQLGPQHGLPHLGGLPHLPEVPHLHVKRPLVKIH